MVQGDLNLMFSSHVLLQVRELQVKQIQRSSTGKLGPRAWYNRIGAKKNGGFETWRLSPNCEEKVLFSIYQLIPPKWTNTRVTTLHNSRGLNLHIFTKAEK
jgi:hypothetical protein